MVSNANHVVELPRIVWIMKIIQTVDTVLVLGLSAYLIAAFYGGVPVAPGYSIFVCIFSLVILIYYFVAIAHQAMYNWIAFIVLESFAVVFWLASWADLAVMAADFNAGFGYENGFGIGIRAGSGYIAIAIFTVIVAVKTFILFCITLGFFAAGIHKHRQAGKPITAGGSSGEKNEMNNIQPNGSRYPEYTPNQHPPQPHFAPQQAQSPYAPSPVESPYSQAPPSNAYEMNGGNRY